MQRTWSIDTCAESASKDVVVRRSEATGVLLEDVKCPRNPQAATQAGACSMAGGACLLVRDGFYWTSALLLLLGMALFVHFRRALPVLEAMPLESWRAKSARRTA